MKKYLTYLLLTLAALCGSMQYASAQIYDAEGQYVDTLFHDHINRQAEDFVKVSLVVCDPCDILYSTLGHACLHLECPTFGLDYFFSYESESVRDKVWTFLKGNLKMGMFALDREEFLSEYRNAQRGVREYTMNLSPQQKQELWRVLDEKVEQGFDIPYDYFHRGCAKAVVQVVNEALEPNAIQYALWSEKYTRQTQREIVRNYIDNAPWSEFEMYFLIGVEGDKDYPCEQKLIVPMDLVEVWQQATINGDPLLSSEARELLPSYPQKKATWCTPLLIAILLFLISWWIPYPMLVVQLALGLLMTYLILFSNLPCTNWNWLLIPFNPLPAILWYWRKYWAMPFAFVLGVWVVVMVAWPYTLVATEHLILVLAEIVVFVKVGWKMKIV